MELSRENLEILINSKTKTENLVISIEELSELQKEITKNMRGCNNTQNLISEVVDVIIITEMLKLIFDINDNVLEHEIKKKMKRNLIRAGAEL